MRPRCIASQDRSKLTRYSIDSCPYAFGLLSKHQRLRATDARLGDGEVRASDDTLKGLRLGEKGGRIGSLEEADEGVLWVGWPAFGSECAGGIVC